MQFRDLNRQYCLYKEEIDRAISEVIQKSDFIHGNKVVELEEKLASYVGVKHCISCANGTDALQLALMAWGIGPGDIVFVPDFTFFSSGEVVSAVGAEPVFVDVSNSTFNIDPIKLEESILRVQSLNTGKPKVVIAVDLFGQPAEYEQITLICKKYNLLLLEDGAQGFGGGVKNRKTCSFGDISTTSFFPAKPLGCYGDGGAIFTNNDDWALTIRSLCVHGKGVDKYDNIRIGMNSRLDTIQAAVLDVKFRHLDEEIVSCQKLANYYTQRLNDKAQTPVVLNNYYSAWAQYTVLLKNANERVMVMDSLKQAGIPSNIYYTKPMHKQEAFKQFTYNEDDFSVTNDISTRCLSLPMHAFLSFEDIDTISLNIL